MSETAAEVEALKAATREAHEVLKDLRAERRAVTDLIDGIEDRVADLIGAEVNASVAKVGREFDRLESIYLNGEKSRKRGDKLSLEELTTMHQLVERHERGRS